MRELFIYYRVHSQGVPDAKAAVLAMQARLRQRHPGLHARLLCRAEPNISPATAATETWMETYAMDPTTDAAGITPELEAAIHADAGVLAAWIDGARHTEAFSPCAS